MYLQRSFLFYETMDSYLTIFYRVFWDSCHRASFCCTTRCPTPWKIVYHHELKKLAGEPSDCLPLTSRTTVSVWLFIERNDDWFNRDDLWTRRMPIIRSEKFCCIFARSIIRFADRSQPLVRYLPCNSYFFTEQSLIYRLLWVLNWHLG